MTIADPEQVISGIVHAWRAEHLPADQWCKVNAFGRGEIELRTKEAHSIAETLILALQFRHEQRHIYLTNIFLPQTLRHQGIGVALIHAIRAAASMRNYGLYATSLVPSFYERLVRRGAAIVTVDDVVMITPETDLSHHHN